ncbi:hypothetical protein AB0M36_19385 [Actinoplanes sp. NPDC051346]|uniref:hypothetical protein n=1 Tax=Actinoplanes sp. NPDC051346 TaxID=3155048 RepID=UPI0034398C54
MTETNVRHSKGAVSGVRLLLGPALVGAVAAACTVPVVQSESKVDCVPDPDDQFHCLGEALGSLAASAFMVGLMAAVCWVVLAMVIGAWRAPTVTFVGGLTATTGVHLFRLFVDVTAEELILCAVVATAVSFTGVSVMLLPRLPRAVRILVGGTLVTVIVSAFLIRPW